MKRLKGPELKMPELKAPTLLADLYYDLRERRLLPLIAVVLVAIVAVPFLLGDSEEAAVPAPEAGASASASQAKGTHLTVVEAKPGLRDYRKRLGNQTPTDPFEQRYTGPAGGQLNSMTETSSSSSLETETVSTTTTTVDETDTSTTVTEPASPGGAPPIDGGSGKPGLTLFTFAIDVQVSSSESVDGRQVMGEPKVRHGVLPTTPLPGDKAPVVTYMGASFKSGAGKALLMISNNVSSTFGDGKCLSGTDTCQLLEIEPGFPVIFVYGPNDVRYKIKVIKIEPVVAGDD